MGNTDKFEMIANRYDTAERVEIAKVSSDAIRDCLVDARNRNAIDFGCGTGLVGLNLIKEFHSMLFVDSSPKMIDEVEQKLTHLHIQNAETLCIDFEKEYQTDIQADCIFMVQVLLHIQDTEFILTRLYDVLNSEGQLIIVDFNKNEAVVSDFVYNGFHQNELIQLMSRIGYSEIQTETFYSGEKIFMGQDASLFILQAKKAR